MGQAQSERIYCNQCGKETQHTIVAKFDRCEAERSVSISRISQVLECGGCRHTVLRKRVHFSEYQEYPGDLDPEDEMLPPRYPHREPTWIDSLDNHRLKAVLQEVYRKRPVNTVLP